MSDALRDVFKNEVIRASAGTGKTFELSNRFIRLLASGADCESILATTFTRKGAGEILDRIVQRLSRAALSDDETQLLAQQLDWKLDQTRVQDLLRELIQNLHRLQIGTLDAFFYRIAQSFRLEMGLPTQWQIVNERQIATLHNQIINAILHDKTVISVLHLMTKGDAQRRIADLIRATVDSLYEIRRQSTREAWNRLQLPDGFSFDRDFSGVGDELMSLEYPHKSQRNRIESDITLVANSDWLELATSKVFGNIAEGNFSYYRKPLPDRCVTIYQQLIAHCRGIVIDMLIRKNSSTFELLDKFGQQLESEKTETGQLRFDDINVRLEAFIAGRQTEDFAFRLDHSVDHLLLDEFQDTSISQWNVIEPFATRTTEDDARKSFFCVGDLKQAIFGWRGGVAEIFDTVENNLSNMSQGRHLTKSYRSSPIVIESVNNVFSNLNQFRSDRAVVGDAIASWSKRFETHETALTNLPGYFSLEFAGDSELKGRAKHPERNVNTLVTTVHRIQQLHDQTPDKTIGVLVRKNETIGELIYMLREAGISASEEGGNPLTDSASVETLLSLVSLADHPGDSIARFHVSHSPLGTALELEPESQANQKSNIQKANWASETLRQEFSRFGYGFTMEKYARLLAPACTPRELSRLQQLVQEAFNYEKANEQARVRLRPSRFVDHIRNEYKASDESSAQIRVMTIHQSKGLEFDIVVIPMLYEVNGWFTHQSTVVVGREHPTADIDLVCRLANQSHRNLLPAEFQRAFDESKKREVMDSLCVLYVAMTRAVHATHVVMSHSCKPDQDSSAAVLLATLHPGERKVGVVYEIGDRNWYAALPRPAAVETVHDVSSFYLPSDATIAPIELPHENRSGRGTHKIAPSGLEGGDQIRMSSIFATIENDRQLRRGSFIHACFEIVQWLDDDLPEDAQFESHWASLGPRLAEWEAWFGEFKSMTKQPALQSLLKKSEQLMRFAQDGDVETIEVSNERPFAILNEGRLMQGTIDRLVTLKKNGKPILAEIIDYKTDSVSKANVGKKIEHYRPQMEAYQMAVSQFLKLPLSNISTKLVFVDSDLVMDLGNQMPLPPSTDSADQGLSEKKVKPPNFLQPRQKTFWSDD